MSVNIEMLDFSSKNREERLEKLKSEEFDMLIIGGGVTGAGIARDATLRGFNVAVVDKNDFASGTSSRSSKMAHGGFRYLKSLEFGLVKESEGERNWLRGALPNLVRPLPILTPSFQGDKWTMGFVRLGVFLYDYLDKGKNWKKGKVFKNPDEIKAIEPALDTSKLRGSGVIYDANVDDARLTIESLKEAIFTGKCVAVNYAKVTRVEHDEHGKCSGAWIEDLELHVDPFLVKARIVVSATGIWMDELLQDKPAGYPSKIIRPTKGVHLVFKHEDIPVNYGFGITSHIDGRFFFVLRRDNYVVIGTTDTDFKEDLDNPICTKEDAEYLLSTVRLKFPAANVSFDRMLGAYAGVRPLAVGKGKVKEGPASESAVSRGHEIIHAADDLIAICGGKLTTFRVMAEDLMLKEVLPLARGKIAGKTFDGQKNIARRDYLIGMKRDAWDMNPLVKEFKDNGSVDEEQLNHLLREYGKGGITVLEYAKEDPSLLDRLVPSETTKYAPWMLAEIKYTVLHDAPVHLIDILARRFEFQWTVHPSLQPAAARIAATLTGEMLGWDAERREVEVATYLDYERKNVDFFYDGPLE
ncbi:MAG TPA: glycerol-3-phosphate dehydrogenase/oxidase [Candidatus Lokiarchaeia archaeon]|nr:glycerol-3-phosphate dehydrogenase/oxidase [Candidatus Lokiarchaeia archaeon]